MVLLKQKETVILFNVFLLESTPLPPTATISKAAFKSIEKIYNGTPIFTALNKHSLASFTKTVQHRPTPANRVSRVNQAHKCRV